MRSNQVNHADTVSRCLFQAKDWITINEILFHDPGRKDGIRSRLIYLGKCGYVERRPSPEHRRIHQFRLTTAGRDKIGASIEAQDKEDAALVCPPCFETMAQFKEWRAAAKACQTDRSDYCVDCTAEYKTEMMLQERCNKPETHFVYGADGEYIGINRKMWAGESLTPRPFIPLHIDGIAVPRMAAMADALFYAGESLEAKERDEAAFLLHRRELAASLEAVREAEDDAYVFDNTRD